MAGWQGVVRGYYRFRYQGPRGERNTYMACPLCGQLHLPEKVVECIERVLARAKSGFAREAGCGDQRRSAGEA